MRTDNQRKEDNVKLKLTLAAALLMVLAIGGIVSEKAYAGNCTTSCYGSGAYATCNTYCW